jgi:hypothetical protein
VPTGKNSGFLFNTKGVFRLFTKDVAPVQAIFVYKSTKRLLRASTWGILDPALCSTVKSNSDILRLHRKRRLLFAAKLRK